MPNWSAFWKRNPAHKNPNTAAQSRLSIRFAERYGAFNIARRIQNMNFTGPEAGRGLCVVDCLIFLETQASAGCAAVQRGSYEAKPYA